MDKTRVFFVVDSIEDNEEIFETRESAEEFMSELEKKDKPRLYVAIVKNAYREGHGWNYDDRSNTFEIIKFLKRGV